MYDPAIGRFSTMDPKSEEFNSWTPYHYVHNNPINLIDPSGMSADWWVNQSNGSLIHTKGDAIPFEVRDEHDGSEDIKYLGEDGMFSEKGNQIEEDTYSESQNIETHCNPEYSKEIAEEADFSQINITTEKETTQESTHPDATASQISISKTISKRTNKAVTYMPKETASKLNGNVEFSYSNRRNITPRWSFSTITREAKTTTKYSTGGKVNAPKAYGKQIEKAKLVYDIYDEILKPSLIK
jgi:uncharacterized protein RhaS with RHS repeats